MCKHIVVKFIFFIPKTDSFATQIVHRRGDAEEMFEELGRDVFVNVIFHRQFDRDTHQVERKHSHPTGAVALFQMSAVRKRSAAIEYADVVEAEESAFENIFAFGIFPIHPPGERREGVCGRLFPEKRDHLCPVCLRSIW